MDFGLNEEQRMIVETTRAFVETELYPHEQMVERTGHLPMELIKEIQGKAMAAGLYAANMPVEVGGAGLDTLSWLLYEKELGRANYALHWTGVARPSNILLAGNADQRGPKKLITAFFVDKGTPGFTVRDGYRNVSHRGYTNCVLEFDDCRVPAANVLGKVHKGFEVANSWLGATRLQVASTCLGRADRALALAIAYAADRKQFGQAIGKFQGVSFKLADMALELKAADLLTREAAWKLDQGTVTDADMAMAKLKATEVLAMVADEAIQIHGGMGLMDELPLERIWRDSRVERIWEGTSEIQRHIISRELLRAVGG